jgi:hypothetical protein
MKSVDTIAELQKFDVPRETYVFVAGYHVIGDGGGGLFVKESATSDTVDNGIIFHSTVAGGQWKRLFQTNEVFVEWWGARGDGNTDDAPAIQAAINYLLSPHADGYSRGGTLLFSGRKLYRCEAPLVIYEPNGQSVAIALKGVTPAYIVGGSSVLSFAYNDKPGIIIQTGRVVHIENLTLRGVNDFSAQLSSDDDWAIDANYLRASAAVRTNRFSPYTAISIDSFDNTIRSGDQYPGLSKLYANKPGEGSKQIHVKNCSIQNWYVGIMIDSSAANAQGDGCFIHHNLIQTCTYGIAIGQTQSRGVDLRDNEFGACRVVVGWGTFGQQNGTPPHFTGGLIGGAKYLFLAGGGGTGIGNLEVTGVYAELICSLGILATSSHPNNWPVVFNSCQFSFHKSTRQAEAHLICGGDVKFIGCALSSLGSGCLYFQTLRNNSSDSPSIEFDNTALRTSNPNAESQIYVNAFTHARWKNASTFDQYWDQHIDAGERHPLTDLRKVNSISRVNRKLVTPGEFIQTPADSYRIEFSEAIVPIGSAHRIKFDGQGGAKLTLPSSGLFKVGDIVRGGESNRNFNITVEGIAVYNLSLPKVGVIASIDGTTATLIEVPSCFDAGKISLANLEIVCMKRLHQSTNGNVTSGSTSITNCTVSGGTTLASTWFIGNRIYGLGIPRGAYVTNVGETNLTISTPAVATNRGTALYDALASRAS